MKTAPACGRILLSASFGLIGFLAAPVRCAPAGGEREPPPAALLTERLLADISGIAKDLADREDWHARKDVAFAIRTLKTRDPSYPEGLPVLLWLLEDPRREVRRNVVDALGLYRDPASREALDRILSGETDAILRLQAIRSLGKIGAFESTGAIREIAREDPSWEMRMEAVCALEHLAVDGRTLETLAEACGDPESRVRAEALRVLDHLAPGTHSETFRECLEDAHPGVRRYAVRGLGRRPSLDVLDRLAGALPRETSSDVRSELCVGLASQARRLKEAGDPGVDRAVQEKVLPALEEALIREPDYAAAIVQVRVLARVGGRAACEILMRATPVSTIERHAQYGQIVRDEIHRALGQIGNLKAVPLLIQALGSPEELSHSVRHTALASPPRDLDSLLVALESPDAPHMEDPVVGALRSLTGLSLSTRPEWQAWWKEVSDRIAHPVSDAPASEAITGWVADLGDGDPGRREAAAAALMRAGEPARHALAEAARSDDPEVARSAERVHAHLDLLVALRESLLPATAACKNCGVAVPEGGRWACGAGCPYCANCAEKLSYQCPASGTSIRFGKKQGK